MNHIDLFSGIGGFSLAASWVWGEEHSILTFCEQDKFCQKILKKHWPNVPINNDIKTMEGSNYGSVDLVTGGFPCQPFSCAGNRRGTEDNRYLWPEMFRIIQDSNPKFVIAENVFGFLSIDGGMVFEKTCLDLESAGYEVTAFVIPACGVGASHKRDRVWIVANTNDKRCEKQRIRITDEKEQPCPELCGEVVADTEGIENRGRKNNQNSKLSTCKAEWTAFRDGFSNGSQSGNRWKIQWAVEPGMGRVANGIPGRVDRLKGLGNAIVPQVVVPIMEAIKEGVSDE